MMYFDKPFGLGGLYDVFSDCYNKPTNGFLRSKSCFSSHENAFPFENPVGHRIRVNFGSLINDILLFCSQRMGWNLEGFGRRGFVESRDFVRVMFRSFLYLLVLFFGETAVC